MAKEMRVVVGKSPSVIVRPSEPTPTRVTKKLTSFDKPYLRSLITSFLVFEHPIHEPVETVKRALSQALVYYYPFSGRIAASDGDVHIRCTGEGVAFVAAYANCALKDVKFSDPSRGARRTALLDELAVYYPADGCGPTDPLLLMQVTEFSCGGFVLGATWNHGVADGAGLAQFLQAVGELARGLPSLSVAPVRWDRSLPSLPPSILQLVTGPEPLHLACLDVAIPSSLINRIKAQFRDRSNGQTCTMFEAVGAVLWQCRTRAIMSDPDSMALLSFAVNVRKLVGAKYGYYGNCVTTQQVMATSSAVVNADIVDLVKMIKCAKDEILDQLLNKSAGCDMLQAVDQRQLDQLQYNTLVLTSWRNIGFEEADFGSGTPARVMSYVPPKRALPVCVMSLPCKKKGGASYVSSVCVKEEHADAFLEELARFE